MLESNLILELLGCWLLFDSSLMTSSCLFGWLSGLRLLRCGFSFLVSLGLGFRF